MAAWTEADFNTFYRFKAEKQGHWNGRPGIKLNYHHFSVGQWQRDHYAALLASVLGINPGDNVGIVGCGFGWTAAGLVTLGVNAKGTEISSWCLTEKDSTEEASIRQCCLDAGVDPDVDKIYCLPTDPGAALTLDTNRVAATVNWLASPAEAEGRAKWIAEHGPLPTEAEVSTVPNEHLGNWQWARDPLDVFLKGGRADPQTRAEAPILDEDIASKQSRRRVRQQLGNNPRFLITEEVLNAIDDNEALTLCDNMARMAADYGGTVAHMLSPIHTDLPGTLEQEAALNWKTYAQWRAFLDTNGFTDHRIVPTVTANGVQAYSGLI